MSSTVETYIIHRFSNVVICSIDGIDYESPEEKSKIDAKVEKKVKSIVSNLKATHSKFEDIDFGPKEGDEYGEKSLYGNGKPDPAGSKYPAPETLRWERPQYVDKLFDNNNDDPSLNDTDNEAEAEAEEEFDDFGFGGAADVPKIWCTQGELFVDGSSSGDVIQGQLGDCWFLSALAVLGSNDKLEECFWYRDKFQEHGIYVLRFFKDCNIIFVIIDDRLPIKSKDGKLIFASCKNANELWVPLIEKAYAKLHGCYKALIGGYTHYGLADMTGKCPRLLVMREGYLGYSESYSHEEIWDTLSRYVSWNCLMGCSIQSNPKEKNKVEADAGNGLHMGHAYSLLAIGEITIKDAQGKPARMKLIKLRNPWGRGEWEGAFSDRSEERELYNGEIDRVFNQTVKAAERIGSDSNDGTFFMPFSDWTKYFTSLFIAMNFPKSWRGKRTQGKWVADQGGNRQMGTWITNPKFRFRLEKDNSKAGATEEYRQVFIGLYIKDSRMTLGYDYFKDPLYATPVAFDIVDKEGAESADFSKRQTIPFGYKNDPKAYPTTSQPVMKQVSYNFGSVQVESFLKVGVDYYIVPSLYKRNQGGDFCLFVYANSQNFYLDNSTSLMHEELQKPMLVGAPSVSAPTNQVKSNAPETGVVLKMSKTQFYEKKEQLRERIVSETKRLNLSVVQLKNMFQDVIKSNRSLSRMDFKRRMIDIGFNLSDFPDDDLIVLDENNDGSIVPQEFIKFFEEGIKFDDVTNSSSAVAVVANKTRVSGVSVGIPASIVEKPADDLLLKGLIDMSSSGVLKLMLYNGRGVLKALSWFGNVTNPSSSSVNPLVTVLIPYDPSEAAAARRKNAELKLSKLVTDKKVTLDQIGDLHRVDDNRVDVAKTIRPGTKAPLNIGPFSPVAKGGTLSSLKESIELNTGIEPKSPVPEEVYRSNDFASKQPAAKSEKKARHNILLDHETREYLCYVPPKNEGIPLREGIMKSAEAPGDSRSQGGKSETEFKIAKANFWDEIIDRVMIVVSSRSEMSSTIPKDPKKDTAVEAAKTNAYKSFLQYKRRSLSLTQSQIQSISNIRPYSALPSPSVVPATPSKTKGHVPTPLSQRKIIASGMASIGGAGTVSRHVPQNKTLTSELLTNKLSALQTEKQYEEIYRRLCVLPVVTQEDMAGERQAAAHRKTDCVSYLNYLLQSFDKARSGKLSKDDFAAAMQELLSPTSNAPYSCSFSTHDFDILFHRFAHSSPSVGVKSSTPEKDMTIDWKAFISFFEDHIVLTGDRGTLAGESILKKLIFLKSKLPLIIQQMKEKNITSIEQFLDQFGKVGKASPPIAQKDNVSNPSAVVTDQIIFQSLSVNQISRNHQILTALGFSLTSEDVARISRIFRYDLSLFMDFIRTSVNGKDGDIEDLVDLIDLELAKELSIRGSMLVARPCMSRQSRSVDQKEKSNEKKKANVDSIQVNETITNGSSTSSSIDGAQKIWQSFASSTEALVPFDVILQYCFDILQHSSTLNSSGTTTSSSTPADKGSSIKSLKVQGISISVLLGILLDSVSYSPWNRALCQQHDKRDHTHKEGNEATVVDNVSFSAWDAFLRYSKYRSLEILLYYLYLQQENIHKEYVYLMVHVYLSHQQDELIIIAEDPLLGEVYTYKVADRKAQSDDSKSINTMKLLPYGKKLQELFQEKIPYSDLIQQYDKVRRILGISETQLFNQDSLFLYNPHDTPLEDNAISSFLSRCKLLTKHSSDTSGMNRFSRQIILGEEDKFVRELKSVLEEISDSLPFFFLLNDLVLLFEVDYQSVFKGANVNSKGIRHFVFSHLRKYPSFVKFVTNVQSTLTIVVSTYNHSYRESFDWQSMLSHMLEYCNSFVTLRLLPDHIPPENYLYEPDEKKKGTEEKNGKEDEPDSDDEGDILKDKNALPDVARIHQSKVDFDGLPHPEWNEEFRFPYQSSKLTTCPNLCTAVVKLQIEQKWKYVVVILRSGMRKRSRMLKKLNILDSSSKRPKHPQKEKFYFLTVYDPRNATEYQCGVNAKHELFKKLYYHYQPNYAQEVSKPLLLDSQNSNTNSEEVREIMELLEDCAEKQMLVLGPAITPRVEMQIFNQNNKTLALLGQCQVSISAVLSGSGVGEKSWVTLTLPNDVANDPGRQLLTDNKKRTDTVIRSGEIQLELSFIRSLELEQSVKPTTTNAVTAKSAAAPKQVQKANSKLTTPEVPSTPVASISHVKSPVAIVAQTKKEVALEAIVEDKDNQIKSLKTEVESLKKQLSEEIAKKSSQPAVPSVAVPQENKFAADLAKFQEANQSLRQDMEKLQKFLQEAERKKEEAEMQIKLLSKEKLDWQQKQQDYVKQISELKEQVSTMQSQSTAPQNFVEPLDSSATVALQGSKSSKQMQKDTSAKNIIASHEDVIETIKDILRVFLARYETRNSSKLSSNSLHSVLDTFQRLCYSLANPEGLLSIKELHSIFRELQLEVTIDDVGKIAQVAGVNSKHLLQVKHLLDIFYNELSQLVKVRKASSGSVLRQSFEDLSSSQQSLVVIPESEGGSTLKPVPPAAKVSTKSKRPSVPNTNSLESEDEEASPPPQNKFTAGERKNRPKSANSTQPQKLPQLHAQTISIGENVGANVEAKSKDKNARTQPLRSQSAHTTSARGVGASSSSNGGANHMEEASPALPHTKAIDWSKAPLPEHWERKYHKPSQRYVYIDHKNKKTQWNHPNDSGEASDAM